MLCLTSLTLGAAPARAGHYQTSFTAVGMADVSWNACENGPYTETLSVNSASCKGGQTLYPGIDTDFDDCEGIITVHFNWVPDNQADPPPQQVVLEQDGLAEVGLGDDTLVADDGLGDTGPLQSNGSGDYSETSQGSHYQIKGGETTLDISCSPKAEDAGYGQDAGVSYSVTAYPITIDLTGTDTSTGSNEALTGQQVTATLNLHGAPLKAGTTPTYSWGQGNINLFKNWDFTAPNATNTTQLVSLKSADYTGQSFAFYDATGEPVTLTCTVKFTTPDGVPQSVPVTSALVTFMKPTASWVLQTVPSYVTNPSPSIEPGFWTDSATIMLANAWWDPVTISDPPGFTGGVGGFAQVSTFNRTNSGVNTAKQRITYINEIQDPTTGKYYQPGAGLDGWFCYPVGYPDNNRQRGAGQVFPAGSGQQAGGYQWKVSVLGHSGDTPTMPFSVSGVNGVTWNYANAKDSFNTWLMFLPPGTNSVWVPIQTISWSWGGTANLSAGTSQWVVSSPSFVCPSNANVTRAC